MSAVPLQDVKAHLALTTSANDGELAFILDAAESAIARRIGRLGQQVVTRRLLHGGSVALLPDRNVADGANVFGTISGGLLRWADTAPYGYVDVTYTVGFTTLPPDLELAVMELVRHLWATQRGNATSGGARAEMLGVGGEPTTAAGMAAYSLPNRVKELLAPYMSTSQIA